MSTATATATVRRDAALDYRERGFPITLCDGKEPISKGWQNKTWTPKEIIQAFRHRPQLNVGSVWGPRAGLIDMECDNKQAEASLLELFEGNCPVTATFRSARGPHRLFAWDAALEQIGKAKMDYNGLEIFIGANGLGAQTLLPPSTTDGFTRTWLVPLEDCDPAPLPESVVRRLLSSSRATLLETARPKMAAIAAAGALTGGTDTEDTVDTGGFRRLLGNTNLPVSSESSVSYPDIEALVRRSLPSAAGQRHRKIFELARELKAVPSLAAAPAVSHRAIVQRWHELALPAISTKPFEDSWFDFLDAWDRVRKAKGESLIDEIVGRAIAAGVPEEAKHYSRPELRLLVAICRQLQRESKSGTFFLSCYTAAELIGVDDHRTAWRWLGGLCKEGILELVTKGMIKNHRASEYRYLGPLEG
ncbi:MAG: bifunctional DNA primase/polymerase [Planctomycetes bacterium]|nr:bifunctional DNA primase/polymerase [Planctomycetota bacterium]